MNALRKLSFLFPDMRRTAARFPLSLACAVMLFTVAVMDIHDVTRWRADVNARLFVLLLSGFFVAGAARLVAESRGWARWAEYALALPLLAGWGAVVFLSDQWPQHAMFFLPALLLLVLVAPFAGRETHDDAAFYAYARSLCLGAFLGSVAGLILLAGSCAALASISYLFELKLREKVYIDILAFCCLIFTPAYTLSWIPERLRDVAEGGIAVTRAEAFILNWILAPLVAVYFLILYAYAVKISAEGALPRGQLAYMITGFGAAGVVTFLAAWPLRRQGGALLRFICRWFFPALLLPALLMAAAIWTRIGVYGVTEARYIIALTALWFFVTALLFILRGARMPLKFIPAFLAVLFVLGAFGPWGGVPVSAASQVARLEGLLTRHGILRDGRIVPAEATVAFADSREISSILDYLSSTKREDEVRAWFSGRERDDRDIFRSASSLAEAMGLPYVSRWQTEESLSYWTAAIRGGDRAMDVRGFDVMFGDLSVSFPEEDTGRAARRGDRVKTLPAVAGWPETTLSYDGAVLTVHVAGAAPVSFDLKAYALARRQADRARHGQEAQEMIRDEKAGDGLRARIYITGMSGRGEGDDDFSLFSVNYSLLLARR